jgi:hypothetical protein
VQESAEMSLASLPIQEKIELARRLHYAWSKALLEEPTICALLQQLRTFIEASRQTMREVGVVTECRHCEEEEGGSCCGQGIEDRYTPVLLLINLLLGVPLTKLGRRPRSCYFLGKKGCALLARHVLCVNYLCARLREKLARPELARLQERAGNELETEFVLYERIKRFILR